MADSYLVRLFANIPPDIPKEQWEPLAVAEKDYVTEFQARGVLERIWRTPGKPGSISIWRCENATELHEVLAGLPLYPYLDVDVEVLGTHYLEADRQG